MSSTSPPSLYISRQDYRLLAFCSLLLATRLVALGRQDDITVGIVTQGDLSQKRFINVFGLIE